ncbi:phenylacetate--CoA ligase family protein, partial [Nitratifractor sp.]
MIWNTIESASREEIEAIQLKRLQETARRVYALNPFYKEKFEERGITPEDIRSLEDLQRLPFTRKQDLRDHYPFGLFCV